MCQSQCFNPARPAEWHLRPVPTKRFFIHATPVPALHMQTAFHALVWFALALTTPAVLRHRNA